MKTYMGMNILERIDDLMEQGISEDNANEIASAEFELNDPEPEPEPTDIYIFESDRI